MSRFRVLCSVGGVALAGCLLSHAPVFAQTPPTGPRAAKSDAGLELEPKAIEILKATSRRLAGAHTLAFTAVETFESPSRQGVPLVYGNKSEVTLQRPNMLRVILTGDSPASEFYYDGKTMTAYAPAENLIATAVAPATIDATLEAAFHSAAIYFPFTDLIVANPYGDLAPGLKHAYYVGQSKIVGGTTTDIVAYAANRVFIEMWVGTEDKLPREIHAIYLDDPDLLRHDLVLSDWRLDQPVPAGAFKVANVSGAQSMAFAAPEPPRSESQRRGALPAAQQ
jgi:hypothetical protein